MGPKRATLSALTLIAGLFTYSAAPALAIDTLPVGLERVEVAGRAFIVSSEDKEWINSIESDLKAADASSVRLADLLDGVKLRRDLIASRFLKVAPKLNPAKIDEFFGKTLSADVNRAIGVEPKPVFVAISERQIRDAIAAGWPGAPYRIDPASNAIVSTSAEAFDAKNTSSEFLYAAGPLEDGPKSRVQATRLLRTVLDAESSIQSTLLSKTTVVVFQDLTLFLREFVLSELPEGEDQVWFREGLAGVMAASATSEITGVPVSKIVEGVTQTPPGATIRAFNQMLLHPAPINSFKEEFRPEIRNARRRKSTLIVFDWSNKVGANRVNDSISAVNTLKPSDGVTLTAILKNQTGVDLTLYLDHRIRFKEVPHGTALNLLELDAEPAN